MFVTFEGIEGSGKSTALRLLAGLLSLRPILLDARTRGLSSRAELHLFLADRAQHVAEIIRPALEAGQTVLCDRFSDSTLAYQGYGRGHDVERLRRINAQATGGLAPDLTLLLDLSVSEGLERAGERNRAEGTVVSEGRFDAESLDFHERVRAGYLALAEAEPERMAATGKQRRQRRDAAAR